MKRTVLLLALLLTLLCGCALADTEVYSGTQSSRVKIEGLSEDKTIVLNNATLKRGIRIDGDADRDQTEYYTVTIVLKGNCTIESMDDNAAVSVHDAHLVIRSEAGASLQVKGANALGSMGIYLSNGHLEIAADGVYIRGGDAFPRSDTYTAYAGDGVTAESVTVSGSGVTIIGGDAHAGRPLHTDYLGILPGCGIRGNPVHITGSDVVVMSGSLKGQQVGTLYASGNNVIESRTEVSITGDNVKLVPGTSTIMNATSSDTFVSLRVCNKVTLGGSVIMSGAKDASPYQALTSCRNVEAAGSYARPLKVEVSDDSVGWTEIEGSPFITTEQIADQLEKMNFIRVTVLDPVPEPTPVPTPVPDAPDVPVTGDGANPALWLCAAVLAMAAAMLLRRRAA